MTQSPIRTLMASLAASALSLVVGTSAHAGAPVSQVCHLLSGGSVQINECVIGISGDYAVTNNTSQDLFGLYISAEGTSNYSPWTVRNGWSATQMTEAQFNTAKPLGAGDFDSWFGTSDNVVNVYSLASSSPNSLQASTIVATGSPIAAHSQASGFYFYASQPTSNFVALNGAGNVVAQTFSAAVPEASSLGMMAIGLAGLAGVLRRRQNAAA